LAGKQERRRPRHFATIQAAPKQSGLNSTSQKSTPAKRTRGGHEPTGTSAGRREKNANGATAKGERTRAAILQAGRVVFERVGYIDARVSEIAREAQVAHGSFYTYFPSKRAVFEQIVRDVGAEIDAAVAHGPEDMPGDTVRNLENANERYISVHRKYLKIMTLYEQVATMDTELGAMRLRGRVRHVDRVDKTITRLQEQGLADPSIDSRTTAGALVSMLSSFTYWSAAMGYDESTAAQTVTMIWGRALSLHNPD
jgi:AcrR family transcriptional regulator